MNIEILAALGEKWTFATPIKTPASKRHFGNYSVMSTASKRQHQQPAEGSVSKGAAAQSLKKKLVMDLQEDEDDVQEDLQEDKSSQRQFMPPPSAVPSTVVDEEVAEDVVGKSLREKLQDLLVAPPTSMK